MDWIRRVKNKMLAPIRARWERKWQQELRRRNQNRDFTLITSNCIGGVIYHNLGLKFLSPTINLYIKSEEFYLFCKDLGVYTTCALTEDRDTELPYPVGILTPEDPKYPAIRVYFQHYPDFESAREKWVSRCGRIHRDNVYCIMDFWNSVDDPQAAIAFSKLPMKCKVLLHAPLDGVKDPFVLSCFQRKRAPGNVLLYQTLSGKRYLDEFDYVDFLNS